MSGIGAAMVGGNGEQRSLGFYPTNPPEPTIAILDYLAPVIRDRTIWECACGDGAMAKVMVACGYNVIATDIENHGYGRPYVDFTRTKSALAGVMITNPPYQYAAEFLEAGMRLDPAVFALLLPAQWANAACRRDLLLRNPVKALLPLSWRVDFNGIGRPVMSLSWWVWGGDLSFHPVTPLERPAVPAGRMQPGSQFI